MLNPIPAMLQRVTYVQRPINTKRTTLEVSYSFTICLIQATFEGWMEVMKDAVDSTEVSINILVTSAVQTET